MKTIAFTSLGIVVALATFVAAQPGAPELGHQASPQSSRSPEPTNQRHDMQQHPYVGMWVTADGRIRHELLPNGRYDEARGERQSAYQGRYEVRGDHIDYWDDTGFTADGVFVDIDTLHHGGMVFYRRK